MAHVESQQDRSKARASLRLKSPAFGDGERIPVEYTADGGDLSPPLSWGGGPRGTRSFALLLEDPDAPSGLFLHWLAWGLQGNQLEVREGSSGGTTVPGMEEGKNGFGGTGYRGPNPPPGRIHHYRFRVYALDARPALTSGATRAQFERAIDGHVLAEGMLVGTYGR
jgi:Raf kinase inhibitor-like YbhB/YbcL family protein